MDKSKKLSEFSAKECKIPEEIWGPLRVFAFESQVPSAWFVHRENSGIKYLATSIPDSRNQKEFNIHLSKENSDIVRMVTFRIDQEGGIRLHYKTYNLDQNPTDNEHPAFPPDKWLHASRIELAIHEVPLWLSEIMQIGVQFPTIASQISHSRVR